MTTALAGANVRCSITPKRWYAPRQFPSHAQNTMEGKDVLRAWEMKNERQVFFCTIDMVLLTLEERGCYVVCLIVRLLMRDLK